MRFLLALSFFISINSYAGLFDSKLTMYECSNEQDANACNSSCKKSNLTVEYKVDKKQNKIFKIHYYDGKQSGSSIYETIRPYSECSIFDEKNWSCTTLMPATPGIAGIYSTKTMANGRVFMQDSQKSFRCEK
jgi:hypothetical protein